MFFKSKLLISLFSVGVIGTAGTGFYYFKKNKNENIENNQKNSSSQELMVKQEPLVDGNSNFIEELTTVLKSEDSENISVVVDPDIKKTEVQNGEEILSSNEDDSTEESSD